MLWIFEAQEVHREARPGADGMAVGRCLSAKQWCAQLSERLRHDLRLLQGKVKRIRGQPARGQRGQARPRPAWLWGVTSP